MTRSGFALALLLAVGSAPSADAADPWQPVRFLQERNGAACPPAQAETEGGLHEHWSFSFDRKRAFEDLDPRWRARETREATSRDDFTGPFELAAPGEDLVVCSKSSFARAKPV